MSRRFGRNQKRHMREALALEVQRTAIASQAAYDNALLAEKNRVKFARTESELNELKSFFQMVANRVGRQSILVGQKVDCEMPALNTKSFRIRVPPSMDYLATYHRGGDDVRHMRQAMDAVLHLLDFDAVRDGFRDQIVAECSFDNVVIRCAYTWSFVRNSTVYELAHQISQDMPHFLAQEMKRVAK